jgi:heme/copper-type cytochrome/quinol oxidase subunit 1
MLSISSVSLICAGWFVATSEVLAPGWTSYPPLSPVTAKTISPITVVVFVLYEHVLVIAGVLLIGNARRS